MYYEQLKAGVIQHDLLVDKLIYKVRFSSDRHNLRCQNIYPLQHKLRYQSFPGLFRYAAAKPEASLYTQLIFPLQDVKLTASNDDYYFVFEDFLYQVYG